MLPSFAFQSILAMFLVLVAVYLYWTTKLPKNFPPGPRRLPIIGSMYVFGNDPSKVHVTVDSLVKRFGSVVGLKFGRYPTVILSNAKVIREAFVEQSELFSNRPSWLYVIDKMLAKNGKIVSLLFQDGERWKKLRRFALSSFRSFGVFENAIERKIQEEYEILCEELEKHDEVPVDVSNFFHHAVKNIISSVCFGSRFEYDDPTVRNLMEKMEYFLRNISFFDPVNFIPFLKLLPNERLGKIFQCAEDMKTLIGNQINQHRESFHQTPCRDLVDLYLENEAKRKGAFDTNDLAMVIFDVFLAGSETTSVSLYWLFLYMIHYPDVQTKCQQEIDHIIGSGRRPCLSDKPNMPYVTAAIQEMQRLANITPMAVPHSVSEATTLCGYFIPKDTLIMASLYSVHMDPEYWDNPEEYRPERWLSPDGILEQKESFMPFSVGPRMCLGDMLAKNELFLFFTAVLQKFTCQVVNPSRPPSLEGYMGVNMTPASYEMIIKQRQI